MNTATGKRPATPALILPAFIYQTQRKMDDTGAADMRCGDLSQNCLQHHFALRDISTRVNPFTYPDRQQSARLLFDEFRSLSDTFSFVGEYKPIMRKLITHMQINNGEKFTDKALDKALAEHSSMESSQQAIREAVVKIMNSKNSRSHAQQIETFKSTIGGSSLPRFNNAKDRINGLGISVHDTWATHITLKSLKISGNRYKAEIHYRVQDHFGLDDDDIKDWFYRQFRIFRIWFTLQRWEGYGFRPFITEMNATKFLEGNWFDKI
ncbi:DUF3289 family protein [Erwiniaceae bacterium BAC15a-03b]|uniref:DUF3289 family protein n=1 Tax=Winslowiella arboricola TaxID=2978220 RepID=A0A9J6PGM9_9GAMM|nr:DUF3289 family protein [Winslowiella arboricola]MCU5771835.1 DUF3289 family protein [Winslowiella arboricola]MCU5777465.1 DUF3289 family protein [Winslowiella arboricola]